MIGYDDCELRCLSGHRSFFAAAKQGGKRAIWNCRRVVGKMSSSRKNAELTVRNSLCCRQKIRTGVHNIPSQKCIQSTKQNYICCQKFGIKQRKGKKMKEVKYFENIINSGDLAAQPVHIRIAADAYQIARIRNSPAAIISKLNGDGSVRDFSNAANCLLDNGIDRVVITSNVSNILMIVAAFKGQYWKLEGVATTLDWDGSETTAISMYYPESVKWVDLTLVRWDSNGNKRGKIHTDRMVFELTETESMICGIRRDTPDITPGGDQAVWRYMEDILRERIKTYLSTKAGWETICKAGNDFHWEHVIKSLPLSKLGILEKDTRFLCDPIASVTIVVEEAEILAPQKVYVDLVVESRDGTFQNVDTVANFAAGSVEKPHNFNQNGGVPVYVVLDNGDTISCADDGFGEIELDVCKGK